MRSTLFVAFSVILACAQAKKGTEADFLATMVLSDANLQDAFDALDLKVDQKIDAEDLQIHYYHGEFEFAKGKFLELTNTDANKDVCKAELDAFLKKQAVTNAVWECTYIKSESMREYCFGDQIMTYTALVLDKTAIKKFYEAIEDSSDSDTVIKIEDVKKMSSLNSQFDDKAAANFLKEIGGTDGQISYADFEKYVTDEDLLDDFRVCRLKITGCNAEYDTVCLKKELIAWTMNHLTEDDVMAIFDEFEDDADSDLDITLDDIKKVGGCTAEIGQKFIKLMDKSKDGKVNYAEFRTYVRSHMVRLHLERDCAKKIADQNEEVQCYVKEVIKRVAENHTPVWLSTSDLDMLFLFEELDKSNNGKIDIDEDLVAGHSWPKAVAEKMIKEIDGSDDDKFIDLEEFNVYVDHLNIVYGISDCVGSGRNQDRLKCYNAELKDNIEHMLDAPQVVLFYKFYDKDGKGGITRDEVAKAGVTGEDVQNFVDEMGMGDATITFDEFKWFVRQQELSKMFKLAGCKQEKQWHETVLTFMEDVFTQYDGQHLFDALDTNDDWELAANDIGGSKPEMQALHLRMDGTDKDKTVNFAEYWIYLHTPIGNARKIHLETECTKKYEEQAQEMECYKKEIVNVGL